MNRPIAVSWRTIGSHGIESVGSFLFTSFLPPLRFFVLSVLHRSEPGKRTGIILINCRRARRKEFTWTLMNVVIRDAFFQF